MSKAIAESQAANLQDHHEYGSSTKQYILEALISPNKTKQIRIPTNTSLHVKGNIRKLSTWISK